jgi:hypothetical protein
MIASKLPRDAVRQPTTVAKFPAAKLVENLCTTRENPADRLCRDGFAKRGKNFQDGFSEGANKNSLNMCREKCRQTNAPRSFPPIHSTHHNNKGQIYFSKLNSLAEDVDVVDCENRSWRLLLTWTKLPRPSAALYRLLKASC